MSAQGHYDPVPQEAPPPRMEGFGSADVTTPLNYGSVNDGRVRNDGLEQKIKKQYWKTKQTLIQKMGKGQDEFVVAGDMDIDMKLEKAYHLRSTSVALLQAISKYTSKLKLLSRDEEAMGRYLMTWSETEYTNAGEVMQNVGKMQESDSQARLGLLPALARMQSECAVFESTAIRDLNFSIDRLEKARTDYRAALLWMKDVSERLRNPDYQNQLVRFREAQAAVKDSKVRFERLKNDLSEKIDMVFASRCNLLSRSLPFYQKELLSFCDNSANAFHKILVDLRSHHHHQYKVKRLLEEIRDLESEETPITQETQRRDDGDEPLLDIGKELLLGDLPPSQTPTAEDDAENVGHIQDDGYPPSRETDPFSFEKVADEAKVNDLLLGGSEAGLQGLQSEVLQPSTTPANGESPQQHLDNGEEAKPTEDEPSQSSIDEIDSLLKFDSEPSSTSQAEQKADEVVDEWSSFSAFMTSPQKESHNPHSGWEKEFMTSSTTTRQESTHSELGIDSTPEDTGTGLSAPLQPTAVQGKSSSKEPGKESSSTNPSATPQVKDTASDLLSDDLKLLGLSPPKTAPVGSGSTPSSGLKTLNPAMFQAGQQLPPPNLNMSMPPYPQQPLMPGQIPMFRSPMPGSQLPILPPAYLSQAGSLPGKSPQKAASPKPGSKAEEGKGTAWMNVFAHLDPLVNEKV